MSLRPLLKVVAAYLAALAAGTYAIVVLPQGRVSEYGHHTVFLNEFGRGIRITQGFELKSDGLHAIAIQIWAAGPANVAVEYRLSVSGRQGPGAEVRGSRTIRDVTGARAVRLEFPEIERSGGSACVLEIRAVRVSASGGETSTPPEVALVAARDRPARNGFLSVGGVDRWGSLKFEAIATGDTLYGRFLETTRPKLPPFLHDASMAGLIVALYSLLLLPAIGLFFDVGPAEAGPYIPRVGPAETGPYIPQRAGARRPDIVQQAGGDKSDVRRWLGVLVCLLLVAALGATWWLARAGWSRSHLIDQLYAAEIETSGPLHRSFGLVYEVIDLDGRPAIFAHSPTRVAWRLTPPPGAILKTAIAIAPVVWQEDGDGVVFRIFITEGTETTGVFARHVDPRHVPADRRWIPVELDLSRYAGREVALAFVTDPSPRDAPPDYRYDRGLWSDPQIIGSSDHRIIGSLTTR